MRSLTRLNEGWKFYAGSENFATPRQKNTHYSGAKTESRLRGFASLAYNDDPRHCDEMWMPVTVPHDFIVNQEPSSEYTGALGSVHYGEGWYRRYFRFTDEDRGQRIILCFEAVATHCEIYFNGCPIARSDTGYTPFEADITDFVKFGEKERNLLAVHVLPTPEQEGWWYAGAGITRDVWLLKTDVTAVDVRGVWVRPVKESDTRWRCEIETTVVHDAPAGGTVTVRNEIDGRTAETEIEVRPYEKSVVRQTIAVDNPRIWDIDDTQMYTCRTAILRGGEETDAVKTDFGFRTFAFRTDGFFLNGRKVYLNGVCNHEDYGITGRALPRGIHEYRVRLMKEMGVNAWRCSHYPQSDETMNALDRLGMIVMAEARHFSSTPEHMAQLETLIRRDRNHPSVFMWSIGNEEYFFTEERGVRVGERMKAAVRRLDPDRAVITAVDKKADVAPIHDVVDVIGINYQWDFADKLHENHPDKPVLYSEGGAARTSRGWYFEGDEPNGRFSGYDTQTNSYGRSATEMWRFITERPYMLGGFHWTGMDYRGEAEWPMIASQSGGTDLFLQKKERFWRMRTIFVDTPEIYLIPHWNWRGREGEDIPVHIYTTCPQTELFLNGESVGRHSGNRFDVAKIPVAYQPGTLCAVGYDENGKELCRTEVRTTGEAVALRLRVDNAPEVKKLGAGAVAHVTAYAVDAEGNPVPDAEDVLEFALSAESDADFARNTAVRRPKILGTGSSIRDHVPPQSRIREMYMGYAAAAVETGRGCVTRVTVKGKKLGFASVVVEL